MMVSIPNDKKGKGEKPVKEKEDEVMRSGPVIMSSDGDVEKMVLAACPSESAAACSTEVPTQQAYDVNGEKCTNMTFALVEHYGKKLFHTMAEEQLLSAFVQEQGAIMEAIQVQVVQASEPTIWIARALVACPAGSVILVPWVASLLRLVATKEEASDGVLLSSIKRPKHLHGGLPLLATMSISCPSSNDCESLAARSPLAGKAGEHAPAAFWCVQEAAEGADARANMELMFAEVRFTTSTMKVETAPPKKRAKPLNIVLTFPVLVNSRSLQQDDTLVFPRGTTFVLPALKKDDEKVEEVDGEAFVRKHNFHSPQRVFWAGYFPQPRLRT